MLSQSKSLDFSIVWSNSYSKLYFTLWAWSDYDDVWFGFKIPRYYNPFKFCYALLKLIVFFL